ERDHRGLVLAHVRREDAPAAGQRHQRGGHGADPALPPLVLGRPDERRRRLGRMTRAFWVLLALVAAVALALWSPPALALDRTFAGSVQVDEHIAPFQPSDTYGTQ